VAASPRPRAGAAITVRRNTLTRDIASVHEVDLIEGEGIQIAVDFDRVEAAARVTITATGGPATDRNVGVSGADTLPGKLDTKLVVSAPLSKVVEGVGGDERLRISHGGQHGFADITGGLSDAQHGTRGVASAHSHADLANLGAHDHAIYARLAQAEVWTALQTFNAGIQLGNGQIRNGAGEIGAILASGPTWRLLGRVGINLGPSADARLTVSENAALNNTNTGLMQFNFSSSQAADITGANFIQAFEVQGTHIAGDSGGSVDYDLQEFGIINIKHTLTGNLGGATAADVYGIRIGPSLTGLSITTLAGLDVVESGIQTASITDNYGVRVRGMTKGTDIYPIHASGWGRSVFQNTNVGAGDPFSLEVLRLAAGNNVAGADGDELVMPFYLDDDQGGGVGSQVEFARLIVIAKDVTSTTKDAEVQFGIMLGNTLRRLWQFGADGVVLDVTTGVDTSFGFSFKGPTGASSTPPYPGFRIRADVGGADALERMDVGWGGQGGANMEFYSGDHGTRSGRLGLTYGAQGAATGQFLVTHNTAVDTWINRFAIDTLVRCYSDLNVVEEGDAEGIKLQIDYVNGNTSGRVFFVENANDLSGFSLLWAGATNPVLGGKTMSLPANRFAIVRHNNSAAGAIVMEFYRGQDDVTIPGPLLVGADALSESGYALELRDDFLLGAFFQELREMAAPSAPAANGCRLWAEDDGAGKTRLMALFATGAAQQIAIQP